MAKSGGRVSVYRTTLVSISLAPAHLASNLTARCNAASIPSGPRKEMTSIMILVVSRRIMARSESLVVLPRGPS